MIWYAVTIALSAFLLFEIQPVIAKMILPWFGGSSAVWTTALMFFQFGLLAGYAYAYCSVRFWKPKVQTMVHIGLLAGSLLTLRVVPPVSWKPSGLNDPAIGILLVLAGSIGLPYFVLSATGPLLQAWYSSERPGALPYWLFAISNAGSLLALISFPIIIEPQLPGRQQAFGWSGLYVIFAILCAYTAVRVFRRARAPIAVESAGEADEPISWSTAALWLALPACASALLLAITNHLTQNVAPIPFLWVLTLSLYLLSFILCFEAGGRLYLRGVFLPLLAIVLVLMAAGAYYSFSSGKGGFTWTQDGNLDIKWAIPLFGAGLFVCCMVCHGELARLKPNPRRLTTFYLTLALGGAIGGLFVAAAAPRLFSSYLELPIAMGMCALLAAVAAWRDLGRRSLRFPAIAYLLVLAFYLSWNENLDRHRFISSARNFYGVLRIMDIAGTDNTSRMRKLLNGTIIHGTQLLEPESQLEPTSYYGRKSGIGLAISSFKERAHVRVGVVGLGAGVLASYCRKQDQFQFYEINPLDVEIANRYFSFLKRCPGECRVNPGDARLTMERQASRQFDVLAIDAFTSDAIPIHLLTREAFQVYLRHLARDGILAVHVSNRYLDLVPIVARNSEELRYLAYEVDDRPDDDYLSDSTWVLVGPDSHQFTLLAFEGNALIRRGAPRSLRTWTDDYSNLYQILR